MLDTLRYYVGGLFRQLSEKDVFVWAEAIAFKALIALVPAILLVTGIFGRVLRSERPFRYVEDVIRELAPEYGSDRLVLFLGQLQDASTAFTIIGGAGLLLTATTLFTTLRVVLANIFREDWHRARSMLLGFVFDLRMAVQVGLFLVASITLSIVVQAVGTAELAMVADLGLDPGRLRTAWGLVVQGLGLVLPFALSLGMFFQLFWFTPIPRPPVRSALAGALVGALLWEGAKSMFSLYARNAGSFEYGMFSLLGDTFILIILIVVWAYYSGLVLCVGAIVTLLYQARHREKALAAAGATEPIPRGDDDAWTFDPDPSAAVSDHGDGNHGTR